PETGEEDKLTYGFRIRKADRDNKKYFSKKIKTIYLYLPKSNKPIKIEITKSFWKSCPELRHHKIKEWLIKKKYTPWEKGYPPKFRMKKIPKTKNKFRVLGEWSNKV
ncbi:MAG: hypothetical protein OXU76_00330, partial [Alphaproteobacteria bacterium]|nr:hypothetical protein [Alphaproteobacteria bacterium]